MKARPSPVLLAVLGVVVLLAAYFLLWKPRADDIASVRAERDDMRQELAFLRATATGTTTTTDPTKAAALQAAVPDAPNLPDVLRQLKATAADLGITVQVITPTPLTSLPDGSGGVVAVTLAGAGDPVSVTTYVTRIGALSRLFVLDKVTISKSETSGAGPDASATLPTGSVQLDIAGRLFTTATPQAAGDATPTTTAATTATTVAPTTTAAAHG
jgi:Tfp pilus assembly protein PilO